MTNDQIENLNTSPSPRTPFRNGAAADSSSPVGEGRGEGELSIHSSGSGVQRAKNLLGEISPWGLSRRSVAKAEEGRGEGEPTSSSVLESKIENLDSDRALSTVTELRDLPTEPAVSSPSPPLEERAGERRPVDALAHSMAVRRRPGPVSKIAQLPAELRALLNQLLDQGHTYEEIVEEMAKHSTNLNIDNVSKWFNGPYQDYLAALEWRDELQQLRDHAFSFGQEEGNVRFQEGVVQIGLTQIFRAMKEDRLKDDAANSVRLFNSLARLSREALVIRKYSDQRAKEKIIELRKLDPNRKISQAEEMAMQDRADDFFGWKSSDRLKTDLANGHPSPSDSSSSSFSLATSKAGEDGLAAPKSDEGGSSISSPTSSVSIEDQNSKFAAASVGPLPPAGEPQSSIDADATATTESDDPKIETQNSEFKNPTYALACGFCPNGPSKLGADFKNCCKAPLLHLSPNGQPLASPNDVGPLPPAGDEAFPESTIEIQNSKISEKCHYCRKELPPLCSDGQRPFTHCQNCGTALRPPGTRHLYCPACDGNLRAIVLDDRRTSSTCPWCATTLPPWPAPPQPCNDATM